MEAKRKRLKAKKKWGSIPQEMRWYNGGFVGGSKEHSGREDGGGRGGGARQ